MRGYIPTLDGWRALAILAVIAHHLSIPFIWNGGPFEDARLFWLSKQFGDRGVDVFFAISGFLITTRLLQEEHERGQISLRGFYIRRCFRILPPYVLYLAALALVVHAGGAIAHPKEWLGCGLFYRNYMRAPILPPHGWFTGHFWSLAVEEHFYLGWPPLLLLCGSKRVRPVVASLALSIAVWRLVSETHHIMIDNITRRTDTTLDGLLWGCWTACLVDKAEVREQVRRWLSPTLWLAGAVTIVTCILYQPAFGSLVQAFLWPWLLMGTILHPDWSVSRLLECRPLRWIGKLSYSLYLWQQLFVVGSIFMVRPFPMGPWQEFPLNLIATFAAAAASYYLIERHMIACGTRLAKAHLDFARLRLEGRSLAAAT